MSRIYLSSPDVGSHERVELFQAFDSKWIAPRGPYVDKPATWTMDNRRLEGALEFFFSAPVRTRWMASATRAEAIHESSSSNHAVPEGASFDLPGASSA